MRRRATYRIDQPIPPTDRYAIASPTGGEELDRLPRAPPRRPGPLRKLYPPSQPVTSTTSPMKYSPGAALASMVRTESRSSVSTAAQGHFAPSASLPEPTGERPGVDRCRPRRAAARRSSRPCCRRRRRPRRSAGPGAWAASPAPVASAARSLGRGRARRPQHLRTRRRPAPMFDADLAALAPIGRDPRPGSTRTRQAAMGEQHGLGEFERLARWRPPRPGPRPTAGPGAPGSSPRRSRAPGPDPGLDDVQAELLGDLVAQARGAHLGDRLAAGGEPRPSGRSPGPLEKLTRQSSPSLATVSGSLGGDHLVATGASIPKMIRADRPAFGLMPRPSR